ncbi:MAG: rubrerythrin family protein [Firmicutes bacterium]|nr:rubrerythrin family protein [Bacillota bacterium]MCM1401480.1 rubrerythrin family protein [Bacteroides sp.]MCM1477415.1 rubrerythrin family protein [Bacteroides sp.]
MSAKSIKGTQTEKLLVESYIAESTAYTRYTFYAQQAGKEQYFPIQRIFSETADNELHHAKVFFKFLEGGKVPATGTYDAGVIGTTLQNLQIAAAEELAEGVEFYTNAAKVAEAEGFPVIAERFASIAKVEQRHHDRFVKYIDQVQSGTVWKRDKPILWQCLVCGYIYEGTTPPDICPACNHPYQHYMALDIYDE